MISAAIKPFIYRQVVRSCSTNSVSSCCKDSKWLCTFGFSELRDRSKTKIHLMCFKSNSEKQKKKKKKGQIFFRISVATLQPMELVKLVHGCRAE